MIYKTHKHKGLFRLYQATQKLQRAIKGYNKREKDTLNEAPKNETKKNKTISISRKKIRVFYITILIVFVILSLLISILIVQKQRYFHFLDGENNRLRKLSEVEEIFRSDNISDTKTHSHKMIVGFIYDPYITESNYKPDNLIKYKKLNKDILNSLKEFSKDPTILTVEIDSIPFDLRNLRNNTKRTLDSLNNKRIENNMQRINIFVWNDFL